MFSISQFLITNLQEGIWNLFSPSGATRISNQSLARALQSLESSGSRISKVDAATIFNTQGLDADEAISFLTSIRILRAAHEEASISIYSPSEEIVFLLAESIKLTEGVACKTFTRINSIELSSLLIAVQDQYSSSTAREIYTTCRKQKCILLHSYFVFRHFVIDGFYSSKMGLPDHFSGLYNLAGLERGIDFKPASWADFFLTDYLAIEKAYVPTFAPTEIERSAALHLLSTRFRPLLNNGLSLYANDLSTVVELNLDTGRIDRHLGIHSLYSDEPRDLT